jgi:OmpA-OmpF porin, OOP family
MTTLKHTAVLLIAGAGLLVSTGCATKNHVRNEVTPIINKTNELDELTSRNTNAIRDVDSRAQSGIQSVQSKADAADQKAQAARGRADEAQTIASQSVQRATVLHNQIANLDNYKPVAEATVHFGFDQDQLTRRAKEALDQLASEIPNTRGYIVEVVGNTDSTGDPVYNYNLSERRASAVVQYLAQTAGVPAHKIHIIGLGEDRKAESNASNTGRARNRRVEVRLMTNRIDGTQESSQQQPGAPSANLR